MKRLSLIIIALIACLSISATPRLSTKAYKNLEALGITNIYSTLVFNNLKYLTTAAPFSTAADQDYKFLLSADLFLPENRTAGFLNTPYGPEVLVDGEFAVHTGGVLDNWNRTFMTEDNYLEVEPYSGISHAGLVDDNAAVQEYLSQVVTLMAGTPYKFTGYFRRSVASGVGGMGFASLTDDVSDNGSYFTGITLSDAYQLITKYTKIGADTLGLILFGHELASQTGTVFIDLASVRPIVQAVFPNYTFNSAGGATGDQYGSYIMARSDGGIEIYKGPLAGAAGTNDITYTKTITTVIGQVYTVVYTAYSDGTGTGQVIFGDQTSSIAATTTTPKTVNFNYTATGVSTDLVLKSRTANGKIIFKGVSVR